MKPVMKFYQTVFQYLTADADYEGDVEKIVAFAKKVSPSWEVTDDSVRLLEQCHNRMGEVEDDEVWNTTINDFVKATFRDLSVLRDDSAMELFDKIACAMRASYAIGEDLFLWARSIKERPDGSAVIVLHVTDLERFRDLIESHYTADESTKVGTLESVVQIYS
jgi:hypothetical protein